MPTPAPSLLSAQNTARSMLKMSWRTWGMGVFVSAVWGVYAWVRLPAIGAAQEPAGWGWLVGLAVVWLAVAGPVVFVLRSYCFRALWDGRVVEPRSYLKGMGSVWSVLLVGAVLALLGTVLSGQWLPGVVVAGVAVGLILLIRPDRRALGLA